MEHRIFGTPRPGVDYGARPGAYGVAFDGQGRAAVIYANRAVYILPGGGIEPGESEPDCIRREIMEETGRSSSVGKKVCVGEEYTFTRRGQTPFHPIGHVYLAELGEKIAPGEPGHELVWLPVPECREAMALAYQAWAVEKAWELYKKLQKEKT